MCWSHFGPIIQTDEIVVDSQVSVAHECACEMYEANFLMLQRELLIRHSAATAMSSGPESNRVPMYKFHASNPKFLPTFRSGIFRKPLNPKPLRLIPALSARSKAHHRRVCSGASSHRGLQQKLTAKPRIQLSMCWIDLLAAVRSLFPRAHEFTHHHRRHSPLCAADVGWRGPYHEPTNCSSTHPK